MNEPKTESQPKTQRLDAASERSSMANWVPAAGSIWRRALNKLRPQRGDATKRNSMLPVLIEVFAAFSKLDGAVDEEDIDSSLGYLRYDYPEAIYSELRRLYAEALQKEQDLTLRAKELGKKLTMEQKVLLGVQLYLLISRSTSNRRQMVEFYLFMTNLGIGAQAIDIVYQLTAADKPPQDDPMMGKGAQPLETLRIASQKPCDVLLRSISPNCSVIAFRYQNLVLLRNIGTVDILVRSRRQPPGDYSRLYQGERVVLEDVTVDYNDLISYFNAKKTVTGTQLYLTLTDDGDAEITEQRSRGTDLRVSFGLGVTVEALRDTDATLTGQRLREGVVVEASIEDSIISQGEVEISLLDLRRRAREFGGQFRLEGSRNTYLVSNNPDLLDEGDILLSQDTEGEILLRIECHYAQKTGELEVLRSPRVIHVGTVPVRERMLLHDGDTIIVGEGQFLRCHFADRIIEEERNVIRQLEVRELHHRFAVKGDTALDGISFAARRGQMICVMGPSGCGKSTLLRVLAGQLKPRVGEVLMNSIPLYTNLRSLTSYIAYIPQEDAFDPLLRVRENLDYSVAVRCPHLRIDDRRKRVDAKLAELGLAELHNRLAGTPQQKNLSGGERKRLNAGLDMIGISDVYLFDEPTSGLSSKDSEHVLAIIRSLAKNKIVFASIHQPSSRLLAMFDKALLLDKGGKMAFFGTPNGMLEYFWRTYNEETSRAGDIPPMPANLTPDYVFDVLETPLRDVSGDVIQEKSADGHLVAARRFPPNFWRDRYQNQIVLQSMSPSESGIFNIAKPKEDTREGSREARKAPAAPKHSLREEGILFATFVKRAFLSKLRNKANLLTTLLEAPALAFLISSVLRWAEDDKSYTFASAYHIPTYLFMSLVVAMFLGLTNSADEIIRDRAMLNRERNHNLRTTYYLGGKVLALATFALLQCVIYLLIGNWLLEIRDMFTVHLWWMFLTALTGACLGLFISSVVHDSRTALNAIPLLLIPQIILGGALIKYEEMNKNLDFAYSIRRWTKAEEEVTGDSPSKLKVPFICQFMPLRWSYEAMLISQAKLNPLTRNQDLLEGKIQAIVELPAEVELSEEQRTQLNDAKDALAIVSGLRADDESIVADHLATIRSSTLDGTLDQAMLDQMRDGKGTSAEDIYVNRKVLDLITKAEMERDDYRRKASPNVFFGSRKHYFGTEFETLWINGFVIISALAVVLLSIGWSLRRQLTRV